MIIKNNNIDVLRDVVSRLSSQDADYADLYIQSGIAHSGRFEDGRMDQLSSSRSDGSGARILMGENTFFSRSEGGGIGAAQRCLCRVAEDIDVVLPCPLPNDKDIALIGMESSSLSAPECEFMRIIDREIRKSSPYVRQVTLNYRTSLKEVLIVRGNGDVVCDRRHYSSFSVNVVVQKNGELQTAYEAHSMGLPISVFWGGISPEVIARVALNRALLMLEAIPCPAGKMDVILDGEAGGTMVHEACGHGLEADIIQKDFSVYAGRKGQVVASPLVTLVDDATLPSCFGSYKYDDEGTPAESTLLIENGILKNYMTDILSAKLGNLPLTGNGRRESSQHIPLPRMSNTFLLPGTTKIEVMLEQVKKGLYVKKMGGGEVNPTSGDYVFYVSEGYLIENGKITRPVRGATLTGNGPQTLKDIVAIGGDYHLLPGVCGKSGQGVPVTDGQPTMLIKNMIVGGSNTEHGTV